MQAGSSICYSLLLVLIYELGHAVVHTQPVTHSSTGDLPGKHFRPLHHPGGTSYSYTDLQYNDVGATSDAASSARQGHDGEMNQPRPHYRQLLQSSTCTSQPYWYLLKSSQMPMNQTSRFNGQFVGACTTNPAFLLGIKHTDACGASQQPVAQGWTILPDTADRSITVSTCGITAEDTVITIRKGCDASGTVVACQNDNNQAECPTQSSVTFLAAAGETYTVFIQAVDRAACWTPKAAITVQEYIRPTSALDVCQGGPFWTLDTEPLSTLRQSFSSSIGSACSVSGSNTLQPQGMPHQPACTASLAASSPAQAWTYISKDDQAVSISACIPVESAAVPYITIRDGCDASGLLLSCSGGSVVQTACGMEATLTFNAQKGEVFTVFTQPLPQDGASNNTCWLQPSITVTAAVIVGVTDAAPPPPRYYIYPSPPPAPVKDGFKDNLKLWIAAACLLVALTITISGFTIYWLRKKSVSKKQISFGPDKLTVLIDSPLDSSLSCSPVSSSFETSPASSTRSSDPRDTVTIQKAKSQAQMLQVQLGHALSVRLSQQLSQRLSARPSIRASLDEDLESGSPLKSVRSKQ